MDMKTRLLFLPLLLALVASLAACGGGGTSVPADSVALVNGDKVLTKTFTGFLTQQLAMSKAQGTTVTPSDPQYTVIKSQVVAFLVRFAEMRQQAKKLGVTVSDAAVNKYLENLAQTKFGGSMSKLTEMLKQQGWDMDTARQLVLYNLLGTQLEDKVTSSAKVTAKEAKAYLKANPTALPSQLDVAASRKLANKLEQRLRNGASFAKLAKQYSKDPSSAAQGGKYTATGNEVPAYQKAAFSLRTGVLSAPVDATSTANGGYGFFIIKALGPVKKTGTQKTRSVEHILVAVKTPPPVATIQSDLLKQKKDALFATWVTNLANQYKGKVEYQASYAPPTTTALPTTATAPATTTG
jgi:parvulin-like peptidyl-prolyl isomerase